MQFFRPADPSPDVLQDKTFFVRQAFLFPSAGNNVEQISPQRKALMMTHEGLFAFGVPRGIRTPVDGVKAVLHAPTAIIFQ